MSHVRYVIMANGKGSRWGGHLGIPKQLIEFGGESLLARITRQVSELDPGTDVVVSSSDPRHDTRGARRHEPIHNEIELDRFVDELLVDNTCFLYGDTFYTDAALHRIVSSQDEPLAFFGDTQSVAGISCRDAGIMRHHLRTVRQAYLAGEISNCIGWQVYQSYTGQLHEPLTIGAEYQDLGGQIAGFNSPEDLRKFIDQVKLDWDFATEEFSDRLVDHGRV